MEVPKAASVVLFYNSKGDILLQDRRSRSKWGEEYGFFGGVVELGETPEQALRRELMEELELDNVALELFKEYTHLNPIKNAAVKRTVYLSGMPNLDSLVCHEGKPELRRFSNSFGLNMLPGFNELLREIYDFLNSQGRLTSTE